MAAENDIFVRKSNDLSHLISRGIWMLQIIENSAL
jgi:hypothetical protein